MTISPKQKKLLKQFLEAKNGEDTYKAEWEAEQFLKENSTYERIQKAKYNYTD